MARALRAWRSGRSRRALALAQLCRDARCATGSLRPGACRLRWRGRTTGRLPLHRGQGPHRRDGDAVAALARCSPQTRHRGLCVDGRVHRRQDPRRQPLVQRPRRGHGAGRAPLLGASFEHGDRARPSRSGTRRNRTLCARSVGDGFRADRGAPGRTDRSWPGLGPVDLRTQRAQAIFDAFVATVDLVRIHDDAAALGAKCRGE